ncbi:MAG: NfeD family protein [Burkholderiales bacterium]|nr:NfeD family protein [Phycisphaerae bacterium]
MLIWFCILLALAIVMLVSEIFLPSGGVLGVVGLLCLLAAVIICFFINRWLGAGVSLALLVITPFAVAGAMNVWQRTPIGRRMILKTTMGYANVPTVLIGTAGVALTELRPMGECEFGDTRMQACSEMGVIVSAGSPVKVISITDGIATVRPLTPESM